MYDTHVHYGKIVQLILYLLLFSGIQRPLKGICDLTQSIYIPKGVNVPSLDCTVEWEFTPTASLKPGMHITGGDIYGVVNENNLVKHRIMLSPKAQGTIRWIAPAGSYTIKVSGVPCDLTVEFHLSNYFVVFFGPPYLLLFLFMPFKVQKTVRIGTVHPNRRITKQTNQARRF